MKRIKLPSSHLVFLFGAVCLYIILWSVYPQKFIASDQWAYSLRAYKTTQGAFFLNPSDHVFSHRLAVFLPAAFFYRLFGVSIITTNLWSLCAALVILITVWAALPTDRSRIFSLILCVTSIPLFKASVTLLPDVIATAFMVLSSLFLFHRNKTLNNRVLYRLYPLLAICCLFVAFLAKLSAYWIFPLWLITIISDVRKRNDILLKRFYIPAVALGIILGAPYLLFCKCVWGDPFARFKSVQVLTGQHLWSWEHSSLLDILKRLTVGPTKLLLKEYGAIAAFAFFSLWVTPKSLRFWAYYTVFTVLFFWFGTTSFSHYEPMPLVSRMTLPSLPGFCILGACFASRLRISSN